MTFEEWSAQHPCCGEKDCRHRAYAQKAWVAALAEEREALVKGLEFLLTTGHAEETNMDVALRQASNAGIKEAQSAIRARQP